MDGSWKRPRRLRLLFPGHECQTARFANLAGLKNGRLLEAAEAADFDILITVEQEHSRPTELRRTEHFCVDSLRPDKPTSRFGATCTRRGFRAPFHWARRSSKHQIANRRNGRVAS